MPEDITWGEWIVATLGVLGLLAVLFLLAAFWIVKKVKPVALPKDAGFFDALKKTPFLVVVFLDVLDLAFDLLGAPVAWFVLGKLGLGKLRGVAVIEALIPFTQAVPTMTICWVLARLRPAKQRPQLP